MPHPPRQDEKHPITAGLIALVSVTLAVGLVLGVVTLVGSHVLGIGSDGNGSSSADQTLYLPTPTPTPTPSDPLVTLAPQQSGTALPTDEPTPSESPTATTSAAKQITLSAGETSVSPMQQIDLSGVYPGGEGAILQVQRKLDGTWQDFLSVDAAVSGGQFSTYVQTGQLGVQKFRVRDTTSGLVSNVVSVTVG
ncbi:hypothetical protein P5P86_00310 [Nocardioides sp. BP30]|uniref:hypothetical protein n=1 Tax=Nocardioides sp. BP30 TaxID=3036374 RepID=UPI0024690696|nr:hypothetical protein [Nocardioides sp. BP30]WGL52289.1 hypothetical protein P5P86_00310 [Nocardioides sp. BP30]